MTEYEVLTEDILGSHTADPGLREDQKAIMRGRLMEMIVDEIPRMSLVRLQYIARFVDIIVHDTGGDAPAEEFITRLVDEHYGGGLKTEAIVSCLEDFKVSLNHIDRLAKRFVKMYPGGITGES